MRQEQDALDFRAILLIKFSVLIFVLELLLHIPKTNMHFGGGELLFLLQTVSMLKERHSFFFFMQRKCVWFNDDVLVHVLMAERDICWFQHKS